MKNKERDIFRQWHYVKGGETISITECRKLKYIDSKLWGDVFHHIYEDEKGKLFCYSEWYSCTVAVEGCWVSYCYC